MTKSRRLSAYLCTGLLALGLVACQKGTAPSGDLPQELLDVLPVGAKRPVEVVLASPRGELNQLDPNQGIVLCFNQPMVPLRPVSSDANVDFIEISPKVDGRFRWKGTATLVFEPKSPLPYSSRYRVTVKKGVKSWSGQTLAQDFHFDFLTPTIALAHSLPLENSEMQGGQEPLYLHFNQPVRVADVQSGLELLQGSKSIPVEVRAYTEADREAEGKAADLQNAYDLPRENGKVVGELDRALVVIPKQSLQQASATELILKPGLKSPAGPEGSTQERKLSFTTRRAFAFSDTSKQKADPEAGLSLSFTSEVNPAEVRKLMHVEPKVELPGEVEGGDYTTYNPYLGGELKPNTRYTVRIEGDLKDRFGESLTGPKEIVIETGDYSEQLLGPEGSGVLELNGTQKIPYGIRNQTSLPVRLAKLTPAQAIEVYSAPNALYSGAAYTPPGGFQKTWDLGGNKRRNQLEQRDVALPGGGLYYLQVGNTQRALVSVSDVGMTLKSSPEQLLIYATTLEKASPVSGADIELLDKSGRSLWKGVTDAEGFCQAPGWAALKLPKSEWENPALWVSLRKGASQSLANAGGYSSISPYSSGVDYNDSQYARNFKAFAFCERGLYKPGETVQLKGSMRELNGGNWKLPELKSLLYTIHDSRDRQIGKGELSVNRFGGFDQSVALKDTAATGTYRVEYQLPKSLQDGLKSSESLCTVTFQVEAFKPAQFEVTVKPDQKHYVMGDKARVELKGWYLFGAPMNDRPMEWSARLEPGELRPEGFEGYDFGLAFDEEHQDESKLLGSGNTTLNERGLVEETLELDRIPFRGSAQLVIEGTATSPNRQRLSGRTVVPLHRGEVQIGLRHDGFFAEAGKPHKLEAVAVLPDGQTRQGVNLKIELVRRQWNSVRKADVTGAYRWVSEVKDEPVHSQELRTSTEAVSFEVTPPKAGYYLVRASAVDSRNNTVVSESGFYASGSDYVSWWRGDQDTVELVSDKKKYKPGDTATVMIKSPYEKCRALITLERERVIERRVVELSGTAPTIQVPLSSRHLPNVYVSVMLLRGREAKPEFGPDGQDLSKPAFKIGYVNLPVEPTEKKLDVKIKLDKEKYQPGEEVVADFEVRDQQGNPVEAELSVAVPDQGVLALIGYELPDWFAVFYGPRSLNVSTSETRMDVIGQRAYGAKGANQGGGGGFDAAAARDDFRYTAYWNPSLISNAEGKAQVRFKLPDNLTTFRLMALAQSASSQFGQSESKFEVQKPLLLQSSTPPSVRLKDRFQAGVVVRNNSSQTLSVKVDAQAEGIKQSGETSRTVSLGAGKEQEVLFDFEAAELRDGKLTFQAEGGDYRDSLALPLAVRQAVILENVSSSGSSEESAAVEMVVPSPMAAGTGVLKLLLSSTALVGLENPLEEVLSSDFEMFEVTLSKVRAAVAARRLKEVLNAPDYPVDTWLARLSAYAVDDKGYRSFQSWGQVDPYLTAYALDTLYQARAAGFAVEDKSIDVARNLLKEVLNHPEEYTRGWSGRDVRVVRSYSLYALSQGGFEGLSYFNNLMRSRLDLPLEARVYLLLAGRKLNAATADLDTLEQDLLNASKVEAATVYFADDAGAGSRTFSSNTKLTALVLQALMGSPRRSAQADKIVAWLMEKRDERGTWGDTHDDTRALEALSSYFAVREKESPQFTATAFLEKQRIQQATFQGRRGKVEQSSTPVASNAQRMAVAIKKEGKGRLYYQMRLSYAPEKPAPARDEGLVVLKKISSLDGKSFPADLKAGETYKVTLTVVSPRDRRFVVVRDPIPAGCEIVQTQFETESAEMTRILEASRAQSQASSTFGHFEKYADRVDLFADGLQAGEHTFQYLIRANQPGTFQLPATLAEEMYHPEVFGTTLAREVKIVR